MCHWSGRGLRGYASAFGTPVRRFPSRSCNLRCGRPVGRVRSCCFLPCSRLARLPSRSHSRLAIRVGRGAICKTYGQVRTNSQADWPPMYFEGATEDSNGKVSIHRAVLDRLFCRQRETRLGGSFSKQLAGNVFAEG